MTKFRIEKNRLIRYLYFILGIVSVIMGIIGIFVPVWPTTVFLLIATWFFIRSSEKYYYKLVRNKYFGKLIRNYREFKGIESKTRIKTLVFLWTTLLISMYFINKLWVIILLICVGIGVTWHLFALRTITDEELKELNDDNYISQQN